MTAAATSPDTSIAARDEYLEGRLLKCARILWMQKQTAAGDYDPDKKIDDGFMEREVVSLRRILREWEFMKNPSRQDRIRMFVLQNENIPRTLQVRSNPL